MNISKMQTRNFRSRIAKAVMALMLAVLAGNVVASPARAEDDRRRDHDERRDDRREWRDDRREWRDDRREEFRDRRVYGAPGYVYAPPPVYYAPPPPPPVIDFVFPVHIR